MTRVLCIDDDREMCELLIDALTSRGFEIDTAHDGDAGLIAILERQPDLVLCDVTMPGLSGFEVLKQLSELDTETLGRIPFIFLTAMADRESILAGRRLGADDYVTKPIDFDVLAEIIRARLVPTGLLGRKLPELTKREAEVLTWAAQGKSSVDIATILNLSDRTVEFHIKNIMNKLHVVTRVQAVLKASLHGMIKG